MSDDTVAVSVPPMAVPLGYDANFEARWDAWRERGREDEAAFSRKARVIVPVSAAVAALVLVWLVR